MKDKCNVNVRPQNDRHTAKTLKPKGGKEMPPKENNDGVYVAEC